MSDDEKRPEDDPTEEPTVAYSPADKSSQTAASAGPRVERPMPASIGPFRILGVLGEGGMGVVYEAEQDHPKRRVALKVIRAGSFANESQVKQFQREADMLARLKHPGIADIYQVGETEEGQPYFVMELIQGKPLDEYLADNLPKGGLTSREEMHQLLKLFRQICDAVNYAHQRGIIHRDLKPSNILIVEPTAEETSISTTRSLGTGSSSVSARAKILDFGIARLTDAEATQVTEIGIIKGTLQYMSPEQTRGRPDEIDIRADVYALGVILYEMLAGKRPYELDEAVLVEAIRIICENGPKPLRESWSAQFRPDPDIETIAFKALEKEPDRRYSSVAAFSEDIERYVASQPILARPPSAVYQIRKMMIRHRGLFALGATMLVVVVVASVVSTALYFRAERAAETATIEAEKSAEVARFMTEMLEGVGPAAARGRDTELLREILDETVVRIDEELAGSPAVAQALQSRIAQTYFDLSELAEAERLYRSAIEKSRLTHGDDAPETLTEIHSLAVVLSVTDKVDEAATLFEEAIEGRRRVLGNPHIDVASTLIQLANLQVRMSAHEEAEANFKEAIEMIQALEDSDARVEGIAMNSLGNLYHNQARYDEAGELYQEALRVHTEALGADHPDVLVDRHNIAFLQRNRGDSEGAEKSFLEILEDQRRILGDDHRNIATVLQSLGSLKLSTGDHNSAQDYYQQALEMTGRLEGEESDTYASMLHSVGSTFSFQGKNDLAEDYFRRALEIRRRTLGPDNEQVGLIRESLASVLITMERYDEAAFELEEAYRIANGLHGPEHVATLDVRQALGRLQRTKGDLAAARETLGEVLEARLRTLGEASGRVGLTRLELARTMIEMGGDDNVAAGEQFFRDSIASYIAARGEEFPAVGAVRVHYGKHLMDRGAYAEAEPLLLKGYEGLVAAFGADHGRSTRTAASIVELYEKWGKPEKAAEWRAEE